MTAVSQQPVREQGPSLGRAAVVLGALVVACWRLPFHFFWADEWGFIADFARDAPVDWWAPHSGHVFPLFRVFYLAMLSLFGPTPLAFHLAALLVWWGVCLLAFDAFRRLGTHGEVALLMGAIFAVHPVNSTVVLWSFEMCVTLQLLFQLLALNLVLRQPDRSNLLLLGALLLVQNLFFANGALFPIVCLAVPGAWRRDRAALCVVLVLGFLGLQFSLGQSHVELDLLALGRSGISYAAVTVGRLCLFYERVFGAAVALPAVVALVGFLVAARRAMRSGMPLFLGVWFVASSAALVGGRGAAAAEGGRLYYTTLAALPVLLALFWTVEQVLGARVRATMLSPVIRLALTCVLVLISQRATMVFTERNVLNSVTFHRAAIDGRPWKPFDDPVIDSSDGMRVEGDAALSGYRYWATRKRVLR